MTQLHCVCSLPASLMCSDTVTIAASDQIARPFMAEVTITLLKGI